MNFENIKKYANYIQNRIKIEIIENPYGYDRHIDFWYFQYMACVDCCVDIAKNLNIDVGLLLKGKFAVEELDILIKEIEKSR